MNLTNAQVGPFPSFLASDGSPQAMTRVVAHTLKKRAWCRVGSMLLGYDGQLADRDSYCLIQLDPRQKFGRRMKSIFVGFGSGDHATAVLAGGAEIELVSGTAKHVKLRIRTCTEFQRHVLFPLRG